MALGKPKMRARGEARLSYKARVRRARGTARVRKGRFVVALFAPEQNLDGGRNRLIFRVRGRAGKDAPDPRWLL